MIRKESEVVKLVPALSEVQQYLRSAENLSINEAVVVKIALDMHLAMTYKLAP